MSQKDATERQRVSGTHRREQNEIAQGMGVVARWYEMYTNRIGRTLLPDITASQAKLLNLLWMRRWEAMTSVEIARALSLTEASVGSLVRQLAQNNWVTRTPSEEDRRKILVAPTQKAKDALPSFARVNNTTLDVLYHDVDPAQHYALLSLVRQLRTTVDSDAALPGEAKPLLPLADESD